MMIYVFILTIIAIIVLIAFTIGRFLSSRSHFWFCTSDEEKMGLSKNTLYDANGYLVHSESEILLGSTGSFKRFDSVDRNAHEGEIIYGQTTLATPPWTAQETISPQPLRPTLSALLLAGKPRSKNVTQATVNKQKSLELKATSAPLKSVPRPVPRKQLSAPFINSSEKGIPKFVNDANTPKNTNPFLNGLITFEMIKSSIFSAPATKSQAKSESKIANERLVKSACVTQNSFTSATLSGELNVFDFNPTTVKSIIDKSVNEEYLGHHDEKDVDPADALKQLEKEFKKFESSGED